MQLTLHSGHAFLVLGSLLLLELSNLRLAVSIELSLICLQLAFHLTLELVHLLLELRVHLPLLSFKFVDVDSAGLELTLLIPLELLRLEIEALLLRLFDGLAQAIVVLFEAALLVIVLVFNLALVVLEPLSLLLIDALQLIVLVALQLVLEQRNLTVDVCVDFVADLALLFALVTFPFLAFRFDLALVLQHQF